jgi:hypothetical protein
MQAEFKSVFSPVCHPPVTLGTFVVTDHQFRYILIKYVLSPPPRVRYGAVMKDICNVSM